MWTSLAAIVSTAREDGRLAPPPAQHKTLGRWVGLVLQQALCEKKDQGHGLDGDDDADDDDDNNPHLSNVRSRIAKLIQDGGGQQFLAALADGTLLCRLVECLSRRSLQYRGVTTSIEDKLVNVNVAMTVMREEGIYLRGYQASDVVEGKPAVLADLVWQLMLYYHCQWRPSTSEDVSPSAAFSKDRRVRSSSLGESSSSSSMSSESGLPRQRGKPLSFEWSLLSWIREMIPKDFLEVNDLSYETWQDGKALCFIVNDLCGADSPIRMQDIMNCTDGEENLRRAFEAAEEILGIPRLLDEGDFFLKKAKAAQNLIDERSLVAYLTYFKNYRAAKLLQLPSDHSQQRERVHHRRHGSAAALTGAINPIHSSPGPSRSSETQGGGVKLGEIKAKKSKRLDFSSIRESRRRSTSAADLAGEKDKTVTDLKLLLQEDDLQYQRCKSLGDNQEGLTGGGGSSDDCISGVTHKEDANSLSPSGQGVGSNSSSSSDIDPSSVVEMLKQELEVMRKNLEDRDQTINAMKESEEVRLRERDHMLRLADDRALEVRRVEAERDDKERQLTSAQDELRRLREDSIQATMEAQKLAREIVALSEQARDIKVQLEESERRRESVEKELQQSAANLQDMAASLAAVARSSADLGRTLSEKEGMIMRLLDEKQSLENEREKARAECERIRLEKEALISSERARVDRKSAKLAELRRLHFQESAHDASSLQRTVTDQQPERSKDHEPPCDFEAKPELRKPIYKAVNEEARQMEKEEEEDDDDDNRDSESPPEVVEQAALLQRTRELETLVATLTSELEARSAQLASTRSELCARERTIHEQNRAYEEQEQASLSLKSQLERSFEERDQLASQLAAIQTQHSLRLDELGRVKEEAQLREQKQCELHETEMNELRAALETKSRELQSRFAEELERERGIAAAELSEVKEIFATKEERLRAQLERDRLVHDEAIRELEATKVSNDRLKEELQHLRHEMESRERTEEHQAKVYSSQIQKLEEELRMATKEIGRLIELEKDSSKIEALQREVQSLREESEDKDKQLNAALERIGQLKEIDERRRSELHDLTEQLTSQRDESERWRAKCTRKEEEALIDRTEKKRRLEERLRLSTEKISGENENNSSQRLVLRNGPGGEVTHSRRGGGGDDDNDGGGNDGLGIEDGRAVMRRMQEREKVMKDLIIECEEEIDKLEVELAEVKSKRDDYRSERDRLHTLVSDLSREKDELSRKLKRASIETRRRDEEIQLLRAQKRQADKRFGDELQSLRQEQTKLQSLARDEEKGTDDSTTTTTISGRGSGPDAVATQSDLDEQQKAHEATNGGGGGGGGYIGATNFSAKTYSPMSSRRVELDGVSSPPRGIAKQMSERFEKMSSPPKPFSRYTYYGSRSSSSSSSSSNSPRTSLDSASSAPVHSSSRSDEVDGAATSTNNSDGATTAESSGVRSWARMQRVDYKTIAAQRKSSSGSGAPSSSSPATDSATPSCSPGSSSQ